MGEMGGVLSEAQETPFGNVTFASCAVVGNGGILLDSDCGEEIDRADFIIRCNLPPVEGRYHSDVGNKTDLVTANPSILLEKFAALSEWRRPFADCVSRYGAGAMLALPAFSYGRNTPLSLRALYTLQDFRSPVRPIFLNPRYLGSLARFWRARGLRSSRLSTGLMMASLALELCSSVRLYGFWPFDRGPNGSPLLHHYYDDRRSLSSIHAMPAEFSQLLGLHRQGVLRIQLGRCTYVSCSQTFVTRDSLKRHIKYAHGVKDCYYKVGSSPLQRCQQAGCGRKFETCAARKAHEKTHKGEMLWRVNVSSVGLLERLWVVCAPSLD
ncbi:Alpha-2,8-sialyltransferase 8E [Acipenser ruthenus]|uniref:Alpha-2,8-sialyltransferase 8E n=1 Tax=Acipenser ruthenus TaxID=7906 RepID=A0A444U9N8_ACIRT|nr:Alpha-2,8-sialyltransferase 8E [Acipenser ruthenus]